ncbi:MAG: pyridoxamine 5'-phosphate oxidase family protein [bacterium]
MIAPSIQVTALDESTSRAFLARNHVGRIAYSLHEQIDIQPIHYVYDDQWLVGRTQVGSKLAMLSHHPWCAFEVDEVRGLFEWDSVVVHGSFSILDPETASVDRYTKALSKLRDFIPGALTAGDPTPDRLILFGVHIDTISGRSARK